jgi:arsenate reductase
MKIGSYGYTAENPNRNKAPWVIYHNPRCSKSREALDLLRANRIDPQVVDYLETPLEKAELEQIFTMLKVEPKEMIRTKEEVFATLNVDLADKDSVLNAIIQHPKLLERPIIVHKGKALICRPPEKVLELMDS